MFTQRISKIKAKKYFYRIFIYFIILITIPAIFMSEVIYANLKGEWNKEISENCNNMVIQTASSLNVIFGQVISLINILSSDPSITDLLTFPDKSYCENIDRPTTGQDMEIYYIYMILKQKALNKINSERYNNEFIDSIYLYDTRANIMYSSNHGQTLTFGLYTNKSEYEDVIESKTGISFLKRAKKIDEISKKDIFSLAAKTYNNTGTIVVEINIDKVYEKIFSPIMEKKGTIYLIVDNKDNVILKSRIIPGSFNSKLEEKLKGGRYSPDDFKSSDFIIESKGLNLNNWVLVGVRTLKDFNEKTKRATMFFILITVAFIVLFILMALFVSLRLYSPIKNIKNQVMEYSSNTPGSDDMESILGGLKGLITSRSDMDNKIKEYTPLVRESIIRNIIMSDMHLDAVEPDQKVHGMNLGFKIEGPLAIAEIEINKGLSDSFMGKIVSTCSKIVNDSDYVLPDNSNNIIFLFNINDSALEENVKDKLNNVIKKINKDFLLDCIAVLGKTCRTLGQIGDSFKEVRSFLQFKLIYGYNNSLIVMDKVEMLPAEIHQQVVEVTRKLVCSIKAGNYIESCRDFDGIMGTLAVPDRCIHIMNYIRIFIDIITNMIRELNSIGIECNKYFFAEKNIYYEFMGLHDRDELIAWFHNVIKKACELVMEQNGNKLLYIDKIREYINQNIIRDISLQDISDFIGLHTAYISKIFKEWTNTGISGYILCQKMEKAKHLLSDKGMKVKEVSNYLGYTSDAYFITAFKKFTGVTPNNFKNNNIK